MDEAHKKAQATRERNREAQARRYEEQAESIRAVRKALQRVMESEDATPEQVLRAAELLAQIGRRSPWAISYHSRQPNQTQRK